MAHPGSSGPLEWWILGVAEPGSCGPKPNIRLWYLQYLFKCAKSSALLCLRPYVCALMSAPLCRRSYVCALLSCALLTGNFGMDNPNLFNCSILTVNTPFLCLPP